jgi:hypothetical protein
MLPNSLESIMAAESTKTALKIYLKGHDKSCCEKTDMVLYLAFNLSMADI